MPIPEVGMRGVLVVAALALAAAVSAEELTVSEVIAAHRAGAPVEGIVRLVREAPEVAVLSAADLDKLQAAGVPEAVVRAMAARHAPPSPVPAESRPDDARLVDVVRLVRAGLSAPLVCEQVRRSGARYGLSANDLVYLKEHGVPEAVIAALMGSGAMPTPTPTLRPTQPPGATPLATPTPTVAVATPTPAATAAPPVALLFEPLVRLAGTFRKAQTGRLVLTGDALEWSDSGARAPVVRTATASLRAVWLATTRRGQDPPLVELRVRTSAGDDLTFRDAGAPTGDGGPVEALYRALAERFPGVILAEKPTR